MIVEIDHFLAHIQENEDYAPSTMANYRVNLRLFERWLESQGKTIITLTHADMKRYRDELKAKHKPNTVNKKLADVSKLLKWCAGNGYIAQNPMTKIKWAKCEEYPKWLTQEQVGKLSEIAQREIDSARARDLKFTLTISMKARSIFVVLLNTGLRVSELCDLKLSDVQNGVIVVRWGKGGKRREVPVNEQARAALDVWMSVRQSDSDFVFVTSEGRITRQTVHWHMEQLGKAAGIRLTPHLLRHTFGKMLADKGIALDRIAKLMGHSNINTTAIYTMPSLADLREVVKLLD